MLARTLPVSLLLLTLLMASSTAQERQVGVLGRFSGSSGTSSLTSWGVSGLLAADVAPRTKALVTVSVDRAGKTYRPDSRGWAVAGTGDIRVFLTERVFVSGGASLGRVCYPAHPAEPAYCKNAFSPRAGAGYASNRLSVSYAYVFPDRSTFDILNGVRVGNRTRAHEIDLITFLPVSPVSKWRYVLRGTYRRLAFIQPYAPQAGTLHGNVFVFSFGLSRRF